MDARKSTHVTEELQRVEQPDNADLVNGTLPDEVLVQIGSYLPKPRDQASLIKSCVRLHSIFQPPLTELAYQRLSQAVIDDDRKTVKKLLDSNPSLVLFAPSKGIAIESQLTWQRFCIVEDALTIAVKRKQIKMITLLLSYCDKLEPTDTVKAAREKALSAWVFYEMQKNKDAENEIVIPQAYADYAQSLIDVFKVETFPGGKLSEQAENALISLFNKLLPENGVKLDDYLDVELLLLAVYKAYRDSFNAFRNWNQRDAFCIRVLGLILSVQAPEIAEIFCEGLDDVVTALTDGKEKEISKQAVEHKLKGGEAFYRVGRDSHQGQGYEFLCDGIARRGYYGVGGYHGCGRLALDKLCQAKATSFRNFTQQSTSLRSQHSADHKQSRCVIS